MKAKCKAKPRPPVRFRCWAVRWTDFGGFPEREIYLLRDDAARELSFIQNGVDEHARLVRGRFVEDRK